MVDIVLSIKSEYAERILTGIKRFEFRKQNTIRVYNIPLDKLTVFNLVLKNISKDKN